MAHRNSNVECGAFPLHSGYQGQTESQYNGDRSTYPEAARFSGLLSDGHNMAMFDRSGKRRVTDKDALERSRNIMKLRWLWFISRTDLFDMWFMFYNHRLDYFRNTPQFMNRVGVFQQMREFE